MEFLTNPITAPEDFVSGPKKNVIDISNGFEVAIHLLKMSLKPQEEYKIISVGSGYGATEKLIESQFNESIITIDPLHANESFNLFYPKNPLTDKLPMFDTIQTYWSDPNNHAKHMMFIDWPYPNDDYTYDMDAIELTQPDILLIRYASCGAAGSYRLHTFLNSCNCPNDEWDAYDGHMHGKYTPYFIEQKNVNKYIQITVVVLKRNDILPTCNIM
jgi:hypothetical protein